MKQKINGLTDNSLQKLKLDVPNNEGEITIVLKFLPTQSAWYMDYTYRDIISYNNKLSLSPNILREFRNIIPFGIAVEASDSIPPMEITAFSSGRVTLNILDKEYVDNLERGLYVRN